MSKYVYDENYERFDIEDALTISKAIWSDGNQFNTDRTGLFVTSENDVNRVSIANDNSYVCGVTVKHDVLLGFDKDDPKYCVVQSLGVCTVKDDGTLKAGDKCMPANDGTAVKSSNDLGYRVVGRVDSEKVQIIVSPNNDMIHRIKVDVEAAEDDIDEMYKTLTTPFNFKGTVATSSALPSSAAVNDTYYVQDLKYRVTWNGSAWKQSSLSEGDYEDEFTAFKEAVSEDVDSLKEDLDNSTDIRFVTTISPIFDFERMKFVVQNGIDVYKGLKQFASIRVGEYDIPDMTSFANKILISFDVDNHILSYSNAISQSPNMVGYIIKSTKEVTFYACNVGVKGGYVARPKTSTEYAEETENNLINACEKIVMQNNKNNNLLTFGYVTDTHYYSKDLNSTKNLRLWSNIGKRKFVDFIAHGGDIINAYANGESGSGINESEALDRFFATMKYCEDVQVPVCITRGNHDINSKSGVESYIITNNVYYNLCIKNRAQYDDRYILNYYKDYPDYGIRIIFLDVNLGDEKGDSTYSDDVLNWFRDSALNTPSSINKGILIFTHTPTFRNFTTIVQDYIANGGKVIAHIYGDTHADASSSKNGFLQIGHATAYAKMSTTESDNYCVSVFVIDTVNNVVKMNRIGLGQSKNFNFST